MLLTYYRKEITRLSPHILSNCISIALFYGLGNVKKADCKGGFEEFFSSGANKIGKVVRISRSGYKMLDSCR